MTPLLPKPLTSSSTFPIFIVPNMEQETYSMVFFLSIFLFLFVITSRRLTWEILEGRAISIHTTHYSHYIHTACLNFSGCGSYYKSHVIITINEFETIIYSRLLCNWTCVFDRLSTSYMMFMHNDTLLTSAQC